MSTAARDEAAARLIEEVEGLRRTRPEAAWEVLARDFSSATLGLAPRRRGELWRLRGHVLRSLRRLPEATAAYRRARGWYRRCGDLREAGRSAIGLVDALMYLGRYAEARRVATHGRRELERAGDPAAQARLLNNEGNLYHRLDQPERALDCYQRARRALRSARDLRGQAIVDINIANCYSLVGRLEEARRLYREARRVHARDGQTFDALNAAYNLAYLGFLEHHHERALDQLSEVRDAAVTAGMPSFVALASLDRSEILLRLGDHDEALAEAQRAASAFTSLGMKYEHAKAETFAALAEFRIGRPGAARARLERTLTTFAAEGNHVWVGEALVGLATLGSSEGIPAAAVPLLAAAVRRFSRAADPERQGCALALLARTQLDRGRLDAAGAPLRRARSLVRRRRSSRLAHLIHVAAAEMARRRGRIGEARRHLRRAASDAERLAARILDEQWRATFWGDWGVAHQELAALEQDSGRPRHAFEALERGRGRVLVSPWRRARGTRGRPLRAWAAARLARDRDRSTRSGSEGLTILPEPVKEPAQLRHLLRSPSHHPEIRSSEVMQSLPEGALLVDYAFARGSLSAFVVERRRLDQRLCLGREAELRTLGHEILFELRRAALDPGAVRPTSTLDHLMSEAASLFLWPLLADVGVPRTLVVVPAGPLARLPWPALPLPDGRRLCEATRIVVAPGLRLVLGKRAPRRRGSTGLVVAASLGELENVTPEAEAIQESLADCVLLGGEDASAARFLELAPRAPWIHFAGHGLFQADRSGLRFHDRWLMEEELSQLDLSASWVTLSACRTARALVRPGEEWFGLPRALLLAGAQAVVAAQWDVNDAAAARLMKDFYGRLSQGASLGQALADSQARLARMGVHPVDWAGFSLLGGPGTSEVSSDSGLMGVAES